MRRPRPSPAGRPIKPADGRRAGKTPVAPDRRLQRQVGAQTGMVIDVFVAQRDRVHPLAQQRHKPVRHDMP